MRALVIVLALATVAAADDKAKAVELFDLGQKEMKAGNFEKACDAFRESLAHKSDSGTRGSLARCYEKLGKVASAHALWVELTTTAPERLRPDAKANADKLAPRLPKWVVKLGPGTPAGMQLTLNGQVVGWKPGEAQPIDPGPWVLEANAAGYAAFRKDFTATLGKTEEIVIALAPVPVVSKATEVLVTVPVPEREPGRTGKKIGIALIGVGGALVVGGGVLGFIAKGRYDDAQDICGGDIDACDPARLGEAQDKVDSARSAGTLSTITMIAGGAALVGGVILVVRSPSGKPRVSLVPTGNGVAITGGF